MKKVIGIIITLLVVISGSLLLIYGKHIAWLNHLAAEYPWLSSPWIVFGGIIAYLALGTSGMYLANIWVGGQAPNKEINEKQS